MIEAATLFKTNSTVLFFKNILALPLKTTIVNMTLVYFAFAGLMPYNFICCQTGCILSQLTSLDELFTMNVVIKLCGIAVMALVPGLIVKNLHKNSKAHAD